MLMAARPIDSSTARYLSLLCALPGLTKEQELSLAHAYLERGDQAARQRVLNANLRHVVALALRYRTLGVPVGDLVALGSLGLLQALDRFDPQRGLRLATYANHWIRAEMLSAAIKGRTVVGGGVGALGPKYALRMRREHARLEARYGATHEVLALLGERYRKTPEQIADILARLEQHDTSLDASSGDRGGLGELLSAAVEPADERAERTRNCGAISDAVAGARVGLSARERYIVEHRLMADDEARQSLKEIGQHFGVSRERARQLEAALKGKLRARLEQVAVRLELNAAA
jgi:RNA polymerase sigma-32 factor